MYVLLLPELKENCWTARTRAMKIMAQLKEKAMAAWWLPLD